MKTILIAAVASAMAGTLAPDFSLTSDQGAKVALSDYHGKQAVVLAFFPKAFTGGCEKEMTEFGRELSKFHALNAEVIGVSYDTPETQRKFALHCAASFPFLSDEGGKVAEQYRTGGGFGPVKFANRRTFVIDRNGVIRSIHDGMPDMPKILKELESLRAAR